MTLAQEQRDEGTGVADLVGREDSSETVALAEMRKKRTPDCGRGLKRAYLREI